ncbi:MAG: hypothetical protein ACREBC_27930, partial [Pyrinomonadaceae bacterium]
MRARRWGHCAVVEAVFCVGVLFASRAWADQTDMCSSVLTDSAIDAGIAAMLKANEAEKWGIA